MAKNELTDQIAYKVHKNFVDKLIWEIEVGKKYKHCSRVLLFGSRSLGRNVPITSDWDIAAQANALFEEELSLDGWELVKSAKDMYLDRSTETVYEKRLDLVGGYPLKIQMVLKADFDSFEQVWWSINHKFYQRFIDKRSENYMGKEFVRQYFDTLDAAVSGGRFLGKSGTYYEEYVAMYSKAVSSKADQPIRWAEIEPIAERIVAERALNFDDLPVARDALDFRAVFVDEAANFRVEANI